jgi:hypothetical protein
MKASALVVALVVARTAAADPSNGTLVAVGVGLAPPMYLAGVSLHEGSHALAAKLVGADVEELHLFPPGIDPHVHKFRFGWTYVHGLHSRADHAFFYIAPKITDTILLGGFTALILTSAWPSNRYGQLALTVVGTGLWVDFAKDVVLFGPTNDVSQYERVTCMRGWRRVVNRIGYGLVSAGLAVPVAYGYYRTFERSSTSAAATPIVVPVVSMPF